ncbi:MAG: rhomboid family intramembrane serine protease [Muribaculaceae bacterium]|nr:rhomboid family intramembrane serine protease [Muribaculaceae bacterium]
MGAFIDYYTRLCGSKTLACLIGINILVFLTVWIATFTSDTSAVHDNFTKLWLCVSSNPQEALCRPWTLATYMVTHYDFFHILFNMLWLYWFSVMRYPYNGKDILWLYIGGGLAGGLAYLGATALWPSLSIPGAYLCGASASVLSVMTALAVKCPDRRINLFLIGSVKLKWVTIACIALTFLGIGGGNQGAQSAHLGGVAFGLAYAFCGKSLFRRKNTADNLSDRNRHADKIRSPFAGKRSYVKRDGKAVAKAASGRLSDSARLDQLLDKIRHSGFPSLTKGEVNELNELSRRIDKMQ